MELIDNKRFGDDESMKIRINERKTSSQPRVRWKKKQQYQTLKWRWFNENKQKP